MGLSRHLLALTLFACIPYALLAYGYMKFTNGDSTGFWLATGVPLAIRFFFFFVETISGFAIWRLYQRKMVVAKYLQWLRANDFPPREYSDDDFQAYLSRIDENLELPIEVRMRARETQARLEVIEEAGVLLGMRAHDATDAALDIYSPKSEARVYGASQD